MSDARFREIVAALERAYTLPAAETSLRGPFEMILRETCAYLVDDERRAATFASLAERVGTEPAKLLAASPASILKAIEGGGMQAPRRAEKVIESARLALDEFDGDLASVARRPFAEARRAFMKFPGFGAPGAEKLLLFARAHRVLALESNGLRALVRLGFGRENAKGKNYAATYRSAQEAVGDVSKDSFDFLIRAHRLLRFHGQATCRATPRCAECPVARMCPSAQPPAKRR